MATLPEGPTASRAPTIVPLGQGPHANGTEAPEAAKIEPWRLWAGGAFVALVFGGALTWLVYPAAEVRTDAPPIPKGEVALGAPTAGSQIGMVLPQLTLTPDNLTLVPGVAGTAQLTISVAQAPAVIRTVSVEPMDSDPLLDGEGVDSPFGGPTTNTAPTGPFTVRTNCPAPPAALQPGGGCVAAIEYSGAETPPMRVVVRAERSGGGAPTQAFALIAPQQRPANLDMADPSAAPAAPVVQSPPPVLYGPSRQESYLERVRSAPIQATSFRGSSSGTAIAAAPYAGWDAIGAEATESSLPVDMSRTITPDRPISAVLVHPINTAQTVTAVAMVDRDIYGAHDRRVLLPRGSRLIGRVAGADTRVGIQWVQIIRPDGVRFVFEGESGDSMGRGGIPGRKRERLAERYGWSALASGVSAGLTVLLGGRKSTVSSGGQTTETSNSRAEAADILRAEAERTSSDVFQRQQSIAPEIAVPAGTRITVWALTDLRLKPLTKTPQAAPDTSPTFGDAGSRTRGSAGGTGPRANYLPDGTRTIDDVPQYYETMPVAAPAPAVPAANYDAGFAAGVAAASAQGTPAMPDSMYASPAAIPVQSMPAPAQQPRTAPPSSGFGGVRPTRPVPAAPQPSAAPVPPWAR